jgi:hypothetical protein
MVVVVYAALANSDWTAGANRKLGGDIHKAFSTTCVAQLGKRKLVLGPLIS